MLRLLGSISPRACEEDLGEFLYRLNFERRSPQCTQNVRCILLSNLYKRRRFFKQSTVAPEVL